MSDSFARRDKGRKLVGPWLAAFAVLCGIWLASILYFLGGARNATSIRLGADRIRIRELEARRAEKDFLLRSLADSDFFANLRSEYIDRHEAQLHTLRSEIEQLGRRVPSVQKGRIDALLDMVRRYERAFRELVAAYIERGFEHSGRIGELHRTHESLTQKVARVGEERLERALLKLGLDERDFLLRPSAATATQVTESLLDVRRAALTASAEPSDSRAIVELAEQYEAGLFRLLALEKRIGISEELGLQGELREAIHAVEPAVEEILADATRADEAANLTLIVGILVACIMMAVLLALAVFFAQAARLHNKRLIELNRRMEEEHRRLLQAERLAAIGEMVAGLTHESRNAFQRTHACLDMLSQEVKDQPEALALVSRIEESQDHIHLLYEQVREYAAPLKVRRQAARLPDVVGAAWARLELPRRGRSIRFTQHEDGLDLRCEIDSFSIEQVFRNILENSLAACTDPVVIDVRYREASRASGSALEVAVSDNGPGLDAEQRQRIFDPFYTTKTRGTGLGMAIARRLVEAHGGTIAVGDRRARGTEIIVTIPRRE